MTAQTTTYRIEYNDVQVLQVIQNDNSITATSNKVLVSTLKEAKEYFDIKGIDYSVINEFQNIEVNKPVWHSFTVETDQYNLFIEVTEIGKISAGSSPITFNVYYTGKSDNQIITRKNIILTANNEVKFIHPVTHQVIGDYDLMLWLNENGYSLKDVIETGLRGRIDFILGLIGG